MGSLKGVLIKTGHVGAMGSLKGVLIKTGEGMHLPRRTERRDLTIIRRGVRTPSGATRLVILLERLVVKLRRRIGLCV